MDTTPVDHEKECTLLVTRTFEQENNKDEALDVKEKTNGEQQDVKQAENIVPVSPRKRKVKKSMESLTPKKAKGEPGKGFCLFVGHLNNSKSLDEIKDALVSFFTSHNVLAQDIELHPNRKFGYVHFVSEEDLKKALQLNKSMVLNKPLRLAMPTKEPDRKVLTRGKKQATATATATATTSTRTLFLNNLDYKIKENVLKKVFPKAVSVSIPQNDGKSRGFAFVEFSSMCDAQAAMKTSQDTRLAKRQIRVELCETKSFTDVEKVPSKTLIIAGLSDETREETLQNAFEGAVSARLIRDKDTGVFMGYGFVDFDNTEDCKATKEAMEDCEIDGKEIRIDYARTKINKPRTKKGWKKGSERA